MTNKSSMIRYAVDVSSNYSIPQHTCICEKNLSVSWSELNWDKQRGGGEGKEGSAALQLEKHNKKLPASSSLDMNQDGFEKRE
jgi:hypothetical protein